ncbi:MAG: hypothetical protein FJX20_05375 [Alphaproteobacteria bacterium]|nr:hypothetical protein [Alphaproteobacteria bacterium]
MRAAALIAEAHAGDVTAAHALTAQTGERWIASIAIAEALVGALLQLSLYTAGRPDIAENLRGLAAAIEETSTQHH